MDLFADQRRAALDRALPLAARMRPRSLDEFVGQEHFLGPGRLLRRLLLADRLTSALFFGPPGCGKTTLACIIAEHTHAAFETLHAAEAGVADVRRIIQAAQDRLAGSAGRGPQRTILFLDEIHRFSRSQQDALLKNVEEGVLILIGATTENPFFSINGPLLSRSVLFEFRPLTPDQLMLLLRRALADGEHGLAATGATAGDDALRFIAERAEGDARRALAALEVAVLSQLADQPAGAPHITVEIAAESLQKKVAPYDAAGDTHYDVTSAFIKSMRGSDPDAAVYWLARMIEGGEDPRFIARRIAILASEDIGDADPRALLVAAAAVQVAELVGLPECSYALAQATLYMACAPKSDAVKRAINAARADVQSGNVLPVPPHLRDASYAGAKRLGRGQGYRSPHDHPPEQATQDYLGATRSYYNPPKPVRGAPPAEARDGPPPAPDREHQLRDEKGPAPGTPRPSSGAPAG